MEFALSKIYTKFYICQILNSVSYYDMKTNQLEFEKLLQENAFDDNNIQNDKLEMERQSLEKINVDAKLKKFFSYQNIVYSKLEIQGLVVEMQTLGNEDKFNVRYILYIDDSTGIIQAIAWKNKSELIYKKIQENIKCGKYIRILGHIDIFLNSLEVIIDQFEIVKNFQTELLFHTTLQKNQEAIKNTNVFTLLKEEESTEVKTDYDKSKIYYNNKKNFANRLLAFFHRYKFDNEVIKEGFIEVKINELFNTPTFVSMIEDFCKENKIEEKERFFKDCFNLLEQHTLGRMVDNNYVEIKIDDVKIKNEILHLLRSKFSGVSYIEIFEHVSKEYDNFFMNDYVKYVLGDLMNAGTIYQLGPNLYQISEI